MKRAKHKDCGVVHHHVLGTGWIHTHGMDRHGLPELEIRDVPDFLAPAAANLLGQVCDYMLEGGRAIKAGESVALGGGTPFRLVRAEPTPGTEDHYEAERLRLEDAEATCSCCGMPACNHG